MDRNHKRAPSVQALDPPPTHLDDTVKVPSFKHRTSDAQGPPPPTPGHVSSGPIFCLHTRPRYLKHDRKIRYITHSRLKTNASIVQALDPHPPTWTTPTVPSFQPSPIHHQAPPPPHPAAPPRTQAHPPPHERPRAPPPPGHVSSGPILLLSCLIHHAPRISNQPYLTHNTGRTTDKILRCSDT